MDNYLPILIYLGFVVVVVASLKKKAQKGKKESSSMPHEHNKPGKYVTYNKKTKNNTAGAQPHEHDFKKYKSMSDASKLPPGYILLNGEPVRVADLEGK